MKFDIKTLSSDEIPLLEAAMDCFATVFDQHDTYSNHRPSRQYMTDLISGESFICLVALSENNLLGTLAAYELKKFEQQRSEIYIYDLAVYKEYRRQGIATALIEQLKQLAIQRGAWVIFVQADYIDEPAINLYSKLGIKEKVLHFDISI